MPHSRIQVELGFILQAGTSQILNFTQNPRQSQSVQGSELNWGGGTAQKKGIPGGGTPHIFSEPGPIGGGGHRTSKQAPSTGGGHRTTLTEKIYMVGWMGGWVDGWMVYSFRKYCHFVAPSCKLELARFSALLRIQDGAECHNRISGLSLYGELARFATIHLFIN